MEDGLTLKKLQKASTERCGRWHDLHEWSLSDWAVAMAGECGETCNVVKKLNRDEGDIRGNRESRDELMHRLGEEIADTVLYAVLLAERAGINLEREIIVKFNEVSDRHGFDIFIP